MADRGRRSPRKRADDGFTIIEVIVALGIFMLVVTALLPQFVAGIRSVATADREGVTKGILQQEIERLRGLPYRVSLGTSTAGTDADVDLLDVYFPNLTPPGAAMTCTSGGGVALPTGSAGTGYVVAGGPRCGYEPPTGAFYRTVKAVSNAELGPIGLVYDLQFLTGGTASSPTPAAVAPRSGYDSDHAVTNYPPSSQVGVTLTILYRDRGEVVTRSLFTQIAKHDSGPTLVRTAVSATAVEITSLSPTGANESLAAGLVSLEGSVGDISSAQASLSGVVARMATGDPTSSQADFGETATVAAPPSVTTVTANPATTSWGTGVCNALMCFGTSHVGQDGTAGVVTDGGLPAVGAVTAPLRASLTDAGSKALSFDNVGSAVGTKPWTAPVVRLVGPAPAATADCPGGSSSLDRVTGAAYLTTALASGSQTVRNTAACAGSHAATIGLLPTTLAPAGILQVTLQRSYAGCGVSGGVGAGATGLEATVQVSNGAGGYQPAVSAASFDPADHNVLLEPLSNYIQGFAFDAGAAHPSGSSVTAEVPGIRITTAPTRRTAGVASAADPDSAVVVTLGAASCRSESAS